MRHAAEPKARDLHFVDVGTNGGIWGITEGYSMMVGGDEAPVEHLCPIFETLAPGADLGWRCMGPARATLARWSTMASRPGGPTRARTDGRCSKPWTWTCRRQSSPWRWTVSELPRAFTARSECLSLFKILTKIYLRARARKMEFARTVQMELA